MTTAAAERPVGLILAGGQGRRLGGVDKPLLPVGGRPLLAWTVERLAPQCAALLLNANGEAARFAGFGLPVVADHDADRDCGPLAGVLAGLDAVALRHPGAALMLTMPGDTPFLPHDLASQLTAARAAAGAAIAAAASGERRHPAVALWPLALREPLRRLLREDGERRVLAALGRFPLAWAHWSPEPFDPFLNVNTEQDRAAADRLARQPLARLDTPHRPCL